MNPFLPANEADPMANINALLHEALDISEDLTRLINEASPVSSSSSAPSSAS